MNKITSSVYIGATVLLAACTSEPLIAPKISGPVMFENWSQQDQATNVQDWQRIAVKIADEMQLRGLLATAPDRSSDVNTPRFNRVPFYVYSDQKTPFIREVSQALKSEILRRNGLIATSAGRAQVIEVGADVVVWGSRDKLEPSRVRSEAVWHATLNSGDMVIMTVQEPFYIFASDLPQYVEAPEASSSGPQLVRIARALSYSR